MNIRELSGALLSLCRTAIRADKLNIDGISLAHLHSMTYRHGLDGSFYYILSDVISDADALEEFHKAHQRLRLVTAKQDSVRQRLLSRFEAAKIHAMPLKGEQIRAFYPEDLCRPSSRINILVEKEKLSLAEQILLGEHFEEIERTESTVTYRQAPYIIVSLHSALAAKDCPYRSYFDEMLLRSPVFEGKEYIHKMTLTDSYIYLLEFAYENLLELGAGIRTIIDLGIFTQHITNELQNKDLQETLKKLKLTRFAEVMHQLYHSWMDNIPLKGSMGLLSDLILAKGFYGTFENYLDAIYEDRSTFSAIFLPFFRMRVAEPWCTTPLLYPLALLTRAYRVIFHEKDRRDETTLPHLTRGLTEMERYAIWRGVGVKMKRKG